MNTKRNKHLSTRVLQHSDELVEKVEEVVHSIKETTGEDLGLKVHIEPEVKSKRIFSVTLRSNSYNGNIIVKKRGSNIKKLLNQTKQAFIRSFHKLQNRKVSLKRRLNRTTQIDDLSFN